MGKEDTQQAASDLVDRLRENIIADAFADHMIGSGKMAERLVRERLDAADEIERLREALKEIVALGDVKYDIESRCLASSMICWKAIRAARAALKGGNNNA